MEFFVILVLAVFLAVLFFAFGRIYPSWSLWDDVDIYYYPLGIIGVVFLFLSNADARARVSEWSGLQAQRQAHKLEAEAPARTDLVTKYVALQLVLVRVSDTKATCIEKLAKDPRFEWLCAPISPGWLITRGLLELPARYNELYFSPIAQAHCYIQTQPANDLEVWNGIRAIRPEFDAEARRVAQKLAGELSSACAQLRSVRTAIENEPLQLTQQSVAKMPSPQQVLLLQLREWIWPVVLILALSMKIGKAEAARVVRRKSLRATTPASAPGNDAQA